MAMTITYATIYMTWCISIICSMFCHGSAIETWNASNVLSLHRLMLMFKLEDVWSCHTRASRRLSSYSQIPRNCAAFDTNNKEENPIDPTNSSTTSSDGLFCSSLLLQNLVCIVHRISLLPMGQLWARSYHYKSGFFKEAPWSRNWVDHSCNSLWLGKVWQFNGAAILDLHHIGSKKIQKKQSQYASEFESLITFSFSSLICQHLPIHPSPKTHRLPTTANILWPLSNDSHIVPCWSCPSQMFPNWWDHQTNESITGKRWKTSFDRGGCLCHSNSIPSGEKIFLDLSFLACTLSRALTAFSFCSLYSPW